ncbi:MAG TPA: hypothetical protein VEL07_05790 [Planctomycetota bacterium]|nr:hypothetical protein [Planctomycetota bacterium]
MPIDKQAVTTFVTVLARVVALALALTGARLGALEIEHVQWGFAGEVVPQRINLLSVLVANPGKDAFDGQLMVRERPYDDIGAPWVATVYLAPGSRRWVQFHPWVGAHATRFELSCPQTREKHPLGEPPVGPPAVVLLDDGASLRAPNRALRVFPAELFPTSVAAMDGLDALVIDHPPRWQPEQRQALRDWVRRGGLLYLLPDVDGRPVQLDAELSPPDALPLRCGSGWVRRLDASRATCSRERLVEAGYAPTTLAEGDANVVRGDLATTITEAFANLVRPDHAWPAIYIVLVLFIAVVGPGGVLLARRGVRPRWVNAGLVIAVVATTWLLAVIGRRGYDERAVAHTVACAHLIDDGVYDTMAWSRVFVTSSGSFAIAHDGDANLYACPSAEAVDAMITAAGGGALMTKLPLYSTRSFIQRGRARGPALSVAVDRLVVGDTITACDVRLVGDAEPGKRWADTIGEAWVVNGDRFHQLQRGDAGLRLGSVVKMRGDLESEHVQEADEWLTLTQLGKRLLPVAAGRHGLDQPASRRAGMVSLLLVSQRLPAFATPPLGGTQSGCVVYRVDLPVDPPAAPQEPQ